jgi:rubrerythrin
MTTLEDTSLAIELVKRAMAIETEGLNFYLEAAQTTANDKGKEVFKTLANDEGNHFNLLKTQYDTLKGNGVWAVTHDLPKINADLSKPLFPRGLDALKQKVNDKSSDMDALLFGMDIEMKSYDLYSQAKVEDAAAKRLFSYLAGQEMGHFNLLMQRFDSTFGPITWYD